MKERITKGGVKKRGRPGKTQKSLPSLRNRIRDLERLLARGGTSFSPRDLHRKQKELSSLKSLRDERARRENERQMSEKYRMVKFFERRKIKRRLRQVLRDGGDEEKVAGLKRDLKYVVMFPKGRKYVGLFPKEGHTEESRAMVEEMRRVIEGMEDGVRRDGEVGSEAVGAEEGEGLEEKDDFLVMESE